MSKKKKTWHSDLPWGRRAQMEEEFRQNREQQERGQGDPTRWINLAAIVRFFKKWRNNRPNPDE